MRASGGSGSLPLVVLFFIASAVLLVTGCTSRLPGPSECESMAVRLIGESPEAINKSPAKSRFLTIVTHGCLTTPFDHQAVRCVGESRSLRRCMEELKWRLPDRKEAVQRFMSESLKR